MRSGLRGRYNVVAIDAACAMTCGAAVQAYLTAAASNLKRLGAIVVPNVLSDLDLAFHPCPLHTS